MGLYADQNPTNAIAHLRASHTVKYLGTNNLNATIDWPNERYLKGLNGIRCSYNQA